MHYGAKRKLFLSARNMRENPTKAEQKLWNALSDKKLDGYKFRRQHPLGPFIADFYCHKSKLVIEVDDGYHKEKEQQRYDKQRTKLIQEVNIHELRFTNEQVLHQLEKVLEEIKNKLNEGR